MIEASRVQALLFDLDGTLIDTDDAAVDRLERRLRFFLRRRARRFARWFMMRIETPGNAFITLLDWLHVDVPVMRARHRLRERLSGRALHFRLIPGVDEMIAELGGRYPVALVTTRSRVSIDAFLAQYPEIAALVAASCGMEDTRRIKPHPEPVLLAAARLNVPVANCLMIGDTRMDVLAGERAGAQTVAVLCGFGERRELARAGADLILETTANLTAWLPPDRPLPT